MGLVNVSKEGQTWQIEQRRVDKVINEINKKEDQLALRATDLKDSVIELRETFWDDVTVNLDEPDDVIETEASIKQQAELLKQKELVHGNIDDERKTLKQLKDNPYFGRIDFKEDDESSKEALYIGISSLMDAAEEDFLIYDWRAPISSLYYDHSLGKASYETLDGEVTGEITLKRQFIIRNSQIKGMFDTGLTIGDQLLQEALGNNASTTMKSIVSTIQKEQNKIIRNEQSKYLLVQGVAGSGKTSAALQRIAYLMYRYRKELNPENVMLFSPNPLFTSYINNVLPELGEANVKQVTFFDYLQDKIGNKFTIESPFAQMEYTLTKTEDIHFNRRLSNIGYKSTLAFMKLIDEYLFSLLTEGVQFKNISFRKEVLISKHRISEYFYSLDKHMTLPNRLELVVRWLVKELRPFQKAEVKKDWVEEKIELLDKEAYVKAYYESQKQENESAANEELILRKVVVAKMFGSLKQQIQQFAFVDVSGTYYQMFADWKSDNKPEEWQSLAKQTKKNLEKKHLYWEEAAPYAYFKGRLLGHTSDRQVRQLFIDEAQDYASSQFAYIQHMFPYTNMTLLGDINQAIYVQMTKENPLIPSLAGRNAERITLTKSYRSTKQIVEFTKHFAPGNEEIEPFEREGKKPRVIMVNDNAEVIKRINEQVNKLTEQGYESTAIICKTMQESEIIYSALKDHMDVTLLSEDTYSLTKGLLIVPIYLAKGIEFDAVIIPDASSEHYTLSERSLFYTACTRAMHELVIINPMSPNVFIKEAVTSTYEQIIR